MKGFRVRVSTQVCVDRVHALAKALDLTEGEIVEKAVEKYYSENAENVDRYFSRLKENI